MDPMQLSIIIPTLNEAELIQQAIQRAELLTPLEIIISDGQSGDATVSLAESMGTRVVVCGPSRGRQLHLGACHASGDVLLFLHADTWLEAPAREQMEAALQNRRVHAGAFRQHIEAAGILYRLLESGNAWRAGRRGLPYGDQAVFMRRETYERLGGFPDVPIMEDLLLMRQLRKISRPVLLPGPLHVSPRRWQQRGVIRQTARNWSLLAAHACGISPHKLAAYYRPQAVPSEQPDSTDAVNPVFSRPITGAAHNSADAT